MVSSVWAEVIKGKLEKVNIKEHEAVVNGVTFKLARDVSVSREDESKRDHNLLARDLPQYIGYKVYCRGREDNKKSFIADFIRVYTYK